MIIPPIKFPLSSEIQAKTLRFYLYHLKGLGKATLENWAGRQDRGDYQAEVAWEKAGVPRPPQAHMIYSTEETVLSSFHLGCMPFRTGETSVSEFSTSPSYPRDFLQHLQEKRHHLILGEPGSGKTWLAQVLDEELSKAGVRVHRYNLALSDGSLAKNAIEATYHDEDTFLIISEAEELIKRGMSPGSVWEILARTIWNERFFGEERLFIKLIVPKALEPFIRRSIAVIRAPIELIELKWSNEDLIGLWRHRIGSCMQVGRSSPSILAVVDGGPMPESFRLKREWESTDGSKRLTKGVEEYLISLASGSPKCLMALGRRFLEHIAYMRYRSGGTSALNPEKEVYESLAMLLEAYYGLRAEPIPECQDVVGKVSGKRPDKIGEIVYKE